MKSCFFAFFLRIQHPLSLGRHQLPTSEARHEAAALQSNATARAVPDEFIHWKMPLSCIGTKPPWVSLLPVAWGDDGMQHAALNMMSGWVIPLKIKCSSLDRFLEDSCNARMTQSILTNLCNEVYLPVELAKCHQPCICTSYFNPPIVYAGWSKGWPTKDVDAETIQHPLEVARNSSGIGATCI